VVSCPEHFFTCFGVKKSKNLKIYRHTWFNSYFGTRNIRDYMKKYFGTNWRKGIFYIFATPLRKA
jgi:hypothetical protein